MGYLFLNLCVGCVDLVKYCECILFIFLVSLPIKLRSLDLFCVIVYVISYQRSSSHLFQHSSSLPRVIVDLDTSLSSQQFKTRQV